MYKYSAIRQLITWENYKFCTQLLPHANAANQLLSNGNYGNAMLCTYTYENITLQEEMVCVHR